MFFLEKSPVKGRLLFFDLLRIGSIGMIVVGHLAFVLSWSLVNFSLPVRGGILWLSLGSLGVYTILFVSGAVLEYSYQSKRIRLRDFYVKRFIRIYPAAWVALVFALIVTPSILQSLSFRDVILTASGYIAVFGAANGPIPGLWWFIGLITTMYLLFPLLSGFIDYNQYLAMAVIALVTFSSIIIISAFHLGPYPGTNISWTYLFPLCNVFEFSLGIYVMKKGWYPGNISLNSLLAYAADLSFFIFLYHFILIGIAKINVGLYLILVTVVCIIALEIDRQIRTILSKVFLGNNRAFP
jgi:peptidoglycan/LPS O-acetylase OafA/YrhL